MSTRRKLCNLCKAELKVPLEAQIVECPLCGSINGYGAPLNYAKAPPKKINTGYGAPLISQYDNYAKSPRGKMNTGYGAPLTNQYDNYASVPPSEMNTDYGASLTSQYDNYANSPPSKMNTGIPNNRYQQEKSFQTTRDPPLSSPSGTEPLSFPLPRSLPHARTSSPADTSPHARTSSPAQTLPQAQTSSPPPQEPPRPLGINSFLRPQVQASPPPQVSPPAQTSPPTQTSPPQPFPQISRPQVNTSGYYQQPLQDSRPVSSSNVSPVRVHRTWEDQRIHQYKGYKGTRQGILVLHSAYEGHQKSGATTAFTGNSSGALPYSFIGTATKEPTSIYEHIPTSIRSKMSEAGASAFGIREI